MKYLVLFAVLYVAYLVWRHNRIAEQRREAPRAGGSAPQVMVSCAQCGLHLPQPDALRGKDGRYYCCQEHRLRAGG